MFLTLYIHYKYYHTNTTTSNNCPVNAELEFKNKLKQAANSNTMYKRLSFYHIHNVDEAHL